MLGQERSWGASGDQNQGGGSWSKGRGGQPQDRGVRFEGCLAVTGSSRVLMGSRAEGSAQKHCKTLWDRGTQILQTLALLVIWTTGHFYPEGLAQLSPDEYFQCLKTRSFFLCLGNQIRNLTPCTSSGADPYVRVYLLPERRWTSRKKTSVKRKTVEPYFDET